MINQEPVDKGLLFVECAGTFPNGARCRKRFSRLRLPAACPDCGTPTNIQCNQCHNKVPAEERFCGNCGAVQICRGNNDTCSTRLTSPGKYCDICKIALQNETIAPANLPLTQSGASTPGNSREVHQQERFEDWFKDANDFYRRIDLYVKVDDPRRFTIRPGTRALVFIGDVQSEQNGQSSLDFFEISGRQSGGLVTPKMLVNGRAIGYRSGTPPVSIFLLDAGRTIINISVDAVTSDNEDVQIVVDVATEVESVGRLINVFGKRDKLRLTDFKYFLSSKVSNVLEPATREVNYETLTKLSGRRAFCNIVQEACKSQLADNGLRIAEVAIVAVIPGDVRTEYQRKLNAVRKSSLDHSVLEEYLDEQVRRHRIILASEHEGLSLQKDFNAIEGKNLALDLEKELQFNAIRIEHDSNLARQENLIEEIRKLRESRETGTLRTDTDELINRVDIETRRRTHLAILRGLETDDKIGDFKDERRFQDFVRETERSLELDTVLSNAELSELHRSIGNKEKYAQVLDDIAIRNKIRSHELDEAIHVNNLLVPVRAGKIADAELTQRLQAIELAMQLESARLARTILSEDSKIRAEIIERNLRLRSAENDIQAAFNEREREHQEKIKAIQATRDLEELAATTKATIELKDAETANTVSLIKATNQGKVDIINAGSGQHPIVALGALDIDADVAGKLALIHANGNSQQSRDLENELLRLKLEFEEARRVSINAATETAMKAAEEHMTKTYAMIERMVASMERIAIAAASHGAVTNNYHGNNDYPRPLI
jgi:hypothetical protein